MFCKSIHFLFLVLAISILVACGGSDKNSPPAQPPAQTVAELETQIRTALDALVTDADFTLLITAENGRTFSHSTGSSTAATSYRSASTSKWVAAVVILDAVNGGFLTLDDNPQDHILTWPTTGNLSQIELRHLLSFTSGLSQEPACLIPGQLIDMSQCVDDVVTANPSISTPGSEFFYSSSHLQVAGLMTMRAMGVTTWGEVFDNFKGNTGLFSSSTFDLPGLINPRLAGGMHWTATEYLAFLQAIYDKIILTPSLISQMTSDQFQGAIIGQTPTVAIGEAWHYGFGNWIECHSVTFNCSATTKTSSPGAYGAYPFIDFEFNYYGIWAREGLLGTFSDGYAAFTQMEMQLQSWAVLNQN